MDYSAQRTLLEAIKSDDLATFNRFAGLRVGTFRMGKFPILSLIFLYDAKKIAKVYESAFIKYNNWEELPLLAEIPSKFASVAGKCLLIYSGDEVVTPIEMLLILDKRDKVKTHYALISVSTAQKSRLQAIYYKKYGLEITFVGNEIVIPRPPLTYFAKRRLILAIVSSVLSVAIIVSTPFIVNIFYPFIGGNEQLAPEPDSDTPDVPPDVPTEEPQTYEVNDLTSVDFASKNTYILLNDVVFPVVQIGKQNSCNIEGNGKSVTFTAGQTLFKENYGTINDVTFVCSGDITVTDDHALIVGSNFGTITDVTVTYTGNITVPAKEGENNETRIAAVAVKNSTYVDPKTNKTVGGEMKGITVDINVQITGDHSANASFAGIVSNNTARVEECSVNGSVVADTCDLAGICADNSYYLNKNVNHAILDQTTSSGQWNPLCAGIALNNKIVTKVIPQLDECVNYGNVTARSLYDSGEPFEENHRFCQAMAAGVVGNNAGVINKCENEGEIKADSNECVALSAGVCASSSSSSSTPNIVACVNRGSITAHAVRITALCGGICGVGMSNRITNCENAAAVTCSIDNCTYEEADSVVGGIVANGNGSVISGCNNSGSVTIDSVIKAIYVGGIAGVASQIQRCWSDCDMEINADTDNVYVGGIAGFTNNNSSYLKSLGSMTVNGGADTTAYVGGIVGSTCYTVNITYSVVNIDANADVIYIGGIMGKADLYESTNLFYSVTCGIVGNSISKCVLNATATEDSYVGGICGYVSEVVKEGPQVYGGTVGYCYSVVTITANDKCKSGAIVGVTGQNVYDIGDSHYPENYYVSDLLTAFGGAATDNVISPAADLDSTLNTTIETIEANENYQNILNTLA